MCHVGCEFARQNFPLFVRGRELEHRLGHRENRPCNPEKLFVKLPDTIRRLDDFGCRHIGQHWDQAPRPKVAHQRE
jgi:hypothetical protein